METPKTEEKKVNVNPEEKTEEAPKKKKNIIRVYHAQNASDAGKRRRPAGEKRPARPGAPGQARGPRPADGTRPVRPAGTGRPVRPAGTQPARPASASAVEGTPVKRPAPQAAAPVKKPVPAPEQEAVVKKPAAVPAPEPAVKPAEAPAAEEKKAPVKAEEPKKETVKAAAPAPAPAKEEKPPVKAAAPAQEKPVRQAAPKSEGQTGRPVRTENKPAGRPERREQERRDGYRQGGPQGRAPRSGDGQNRPVRSGDGQNRPARSGDGNRPVRSGDGRPRTGGAPGRTGGFAGRTDGARSDNRFGTQNRPAGQRPGTRKPGGADAGFSSDFGKNGKDARRDRDSKNKKKEFDKTGTTGQRRPNQGGNKQGQRLPKALQKPHTAPKEEKKPEIKEITIPEKLTIRELADAMKMPPSVIVKKLFMQGIMVTVNQEIDFDKAEEIAMEFDIVAEKEEKVDVIEELLKEDEEDESLMIPRPPVVCVMGHVDHGKTSLLDAIRKTNVTRGEAGGITQHIGAYMVQINGQDITFLDTPGHEAFTAMRMRGANATDIAVLVVAADDGVMPQTVEAISHAKAAGVEIIVAINKIDKPSANIDRVKQEMSEYELIPEDWGGSTIFVPVSAHTGEGIDTLLEMILLTAEVAELKANPKRAARGLVIEARLDKGKGPVATILVQKGTLHIGDFIAAGACSGKVRAMMDDKGRRVKEAGPSMPVEILGLGDVPNAGEVLMSFDSDKEAKNFAGAFVSENKNRLLEETKGKLSLDNLFDQIQASDLKELPIVVKADVQGSVEAVRQSLVKLSNEEVVVKVIHGGVGAINESDVSLASTSNAIIIGFNVRPDATAKQLAEQENVDMRLYKVIYQAIEDVEAAMKGMLDPIFEEKVIGHAEVRQLIKASGVGTIAGSYILDGVFQRNCKVRITREDEQVYEGELASLKRFKDDVKEVKAGYECGLVFDGFNDLKEEDKVEAYIMVEVPR